ncbi:MAG TPA: hypothetical protein VK508_06070 [Cyclobacteriaceae bacterium]|nr:hypothetical protein [Cyclobacteriaceae bacterium]
MRQILTIPVVVAMIVFQSCDSRINIDEPQQFYKYIGSDGDQESVDLVVDAANNIYILGKTSSVSNGDQLYVVKTSPKGEVVWEKVFGDPGQEIPKDIELASNGDLVLVAERVDIATGEQDFVIYRLNSGNGSVIGTPTTGGYPGVVDYVNTITESSDGFLVCSYSDNGPYKDGSVFRYDASLKMYPSNIWPEKVDIKDASGGYDIIPVKAVQVGPDLFYTFCYSNSKLLGDQIADYNFFIHVSNQFNGGKNDLVIPSADPLSDERLTSVSAIPAAAGSGFIMAGYTSSSGQQELYLIKVVQDLEFSSSDPNSFLQVPPRTIQTSLSPIAPTKASVFPSKSSGFLVLGNLNSEGNENMFLMKVDNLLAEAWSAPQVLGGQGNDMAGAVTETSNGRILICGTMVLGDVIGQKKVVLMNLSPNGMFGD